MAPIICVPICFLSLSVRMCFILYFPCLFPICVPSFCPYAPTEALRRQGRQRGRLLPHGAVQRVCRGLVFTVWAVLVQLYHEHKFLDGFCNVYSL